DRATSLCGRDAVQIIPAHARELDLEKLASILGEHGEFLIKGPVLKGKLRDEGLHITLFRNARALIGGTEDENRARAIYDRYITK
ncbi:MAG: NAD(P)H-binding protein, partial [Planctomycetota bacterium]